MITDKRLIFILSSMVLTLVADLFAWYIHSGWIGAALITFILNFVIIYYFVKQKDTLLARLYFFDPTRRLLVLPKFMDDFF